MSLPTVGKYAENIYPAPASDIVGASPIVDGVNFNAEWWGDNDTSDGTRLRVSFGGVEVASDPFQFDDVAEELLFRFDGGTILAASSDAARTIRTFTPNTRNVSYGVSDTYGQYNAYDSSWDRYYPIYGDTSAATDRTSNQQDGIINTGVSVSAGKLVFAASNEGLDVPDSGLEGGTEFSVIMSCDPVDVSTDRGLFYTDAHSGSDPVLFWLDNAGTDHIGSIVNTSAGGSGAVYSGYVPATDPIGIGYAWDSGNDIDLVVNGAEDTTGSYPYNGLGGTLDLSYTTYYTIGNDSGHNKDFYGDIWNIQIHSLYRSISWRSEEYAFTNNNASKWGTWTTGTLGAEVIIEPIINESEDITVSLLSGKSIIPTINESEVITTSLLTAKIILANVNESETITASLLSGKSILATINESEVITAILLTESASQEVILTPVVNESETITALLLTAKSLSPIINESEDIIAILKNRLPLNPVINESEAITVNLVVSGEGNVYYKVLITDGDLITELETKADLTTEFAMDADMTTILRTKGDIA